MKSLILSLILLAQMLFASAQFVNPPGFYRIRIDASEVVSYEGTGIGAIGLWLYLPTANPLVNGQECDTCLIPSEWFYHGIGERTTSIDQSAKGDTNELPQMLISGHLPYYYSQEGSNFVANRRFAAPGKLDSFPYAMIAIQCWGNYTWFYKFYTYNVLRYVKKKVREKHPLFKRLDTTRFHANGLSFGGGHVSLIANDTILSPQFATLRGICNGYGSYSGRPYNWPNAGKKPTWWEHAIDDLPSNGGQRVDTTDKIVRMINANNPLFPVIYLRYLNGGHPIWTRGFSWANRVNNYTLANGQIWSYSGQYPHGYRQWQLQYTTINTRPPKNIDQPRVPYEQ